MFHKEGFQIILITFLLVAAISIGAEYAFTNLYISKRNPSCHHRNIGISVAVF